MYDSIWYLLAASLFTESICVASLHKTGWSLECAMPSLSDIKTVFPGFLAIFLLAIILPSYMILVQRVKKFPPGPKGLPWIGSPWSMPRTKEWITYGLWKRKYGPVVGVQVFGQPLVILNTASVAHELLTNRSRVYSERPPFPMLEM